MTEIFLCHFFIMTYKETVEWMFAQLPVYQFQGASAYKVDLTNTLLLTAHLGNPEREVKTVHIAGTNGKGSVSNMLASILQEAGYKTGLYTSPHLKDFRERIKINGEDISEDFVVRFIEDNKPFFEANQLSFFEMTVGLAFDYFNKEKVDIAIIETGLGGRLDSTNVITPLVSVVTNIGMDHMQFLGDTLTAIAGEKAGIIKPGIPAVLGEYTEETKPVFIAKAEKEKAPLYFASDEIIEDYASDLTGDYQKQNRKTVLKTVELLQEHFTVTNKHISNGLLHVAQNTGFKGRWQQIHESPITIADTAHNSHGLKIVMNQLQQQQYDTLRIVLGVVNDKDLPSILPLFPKNAVYYFSKPDVPRGLDAALLKQAANDFGLNGEIYSSIPEAYKAALNDAAATDFIYVGGSTFVVAEVL